MRCISIAGEGSGPIDAFVSALSQSINEPLNVVDYQEYALNEGSNAKAISIIAEAGKINDGEQALAAPSISGLSD